MRFGSGESGHVARIVLFIGSDSWSIGIVMSVPTPLIPGGPPGGGVAANRVARPAADFDELSRVEPLGSPGGAQVVGGAPQLSGKILMLLAGAGVGGRKVRGAIA